jgi:hypothetical protein
LIITDIAEEIEAKQGSEAASMYFRIATSDDPVLEEVEKRWLPEVGETVSGQIPLLVAEVAGLHLDQDQRPHRLEDGVEIPVTT